MQTKYILWMLGIEIAITAIGFGIIIYRHQRSRRIERRMNGKVEVEYDKDETKWIFPRERKKK